MGVRNILKQYHLSAQRSLSQSFLYSKPIVNRIVEEAKLTSGDVVLEIGTGLGILTQALQDKVKKVVTIEKDKKLAPYLEELFAQNPKIELLMEDFLNFDLNDFTKRYPRIKIVSNLPYHLSTEILFKLFSYQKAIESMTLMFQKEVAKRIIADAGSKEYGVLSVLSQLYADPHLCFLVSKGNFYPMPEVDSAVVHFILRKEFIIPLNQEKLFIQMVKAGFGQRRKMLLNSLQKIFSLVFLKELQEKSGLDLKRRIETFSLEEIKKLTQAAFQMKED